MSKNASKKFYDQMQKCCGGHVWIYTKVGARKPRWSARISLPGRTGYVVRSLKTTDQEEALVRAREVFNELKDRHRLKLPLNKMKFRELFSIYREWRVSRLKDERNERRRGYLQSRLRYYDIQMRCYWDEYMGDLDILDLIAEPETLIRYGDWRIAYWQKHATVERLRESRGRHRDVPAYGTVHNELRALKSIFIWAEKRRYVDHVPHIPHPQGPRSSDKDHARFGSFEISRDGGDSEWVAFTKLLNRWAEEAYRPDSEWKHQVWPRERLRALIFIISHSGLRATEAYSLKHRDITLRPGPNGMKYPVIKILSVKVGKDREVICNDGVWPAYQRLCEVSRYTSDDDWVFANARGERIKDMAHTHQRFIESLGLRYDKEGRRRTLTSYRHVYATMRLQKGGVPIAMLAENMGTSIEMIERHYSHLQTWGVRDVLRANSPLLGGGISDDA